MRRLHKQPLRSLLILLLTLSFAFAIGCGGQSDDPFDNQGIDIPDVEDSDVEDDTDADPNDPDADPGDTDDNDTEDPEDPEDPVEPVICDDPIPAAPAGERCSVTPGTNGHILLRGTILAGDDVFYEGSLLIDDQAPNRQVLCSGCGCADEDKAQDATIIACPTGIISPGFLNPHDHLTYAEGRPQTHGDERFDHRNDWRRGIRGHRELSTKPRSSGGAGRHGVLLGELRMLFGGSTSIAGSTGNTNVSGLLRNLDTQYTEGLSGIDVNYSTFPLDDGRSNLQETSCSFNIESESNVTNRGIYLPHIAEGIDSRAQLELHCMAGESGRNLIRENTSIIHGMAVDARDVALIADRGAKLVWSPRTNIDLYGNTAPVTLYKTFGVPIALGTDWSTSGSMNMLRELQCADYLNQNHFNNTFSDREIWQMATANAALALGAEDVLGSLLPGYVADIAIFDGDGTNPYRSVLEADIDEVTLVMRGGEPLYGDASIIESLVPQSEVGACETLDVCSRDRRLCLERDANLTLSEIWNRVHNNSYPIFFCGEPEDEPTCIPSRPGEYDGSLTDIDRAGDGVPDGEDNCPDYFNPIRPMDKGAQSDLNDNGVGDVCDPCPLSGDPNCTEVDPNDWSGDGVPNDADNCPFHYNPDQEDSSGDGIGDVCHPCLGRPLASDGTCTGSIYEINTQTIAEGARIAIPNALVTASRPGEGLFIQIHPDDSGYNGAENSGLYVYLRNYSGTFPIQGDRINLSGSVSHFYGQIQLADITNVEIVSTDNPLPEPLLVDPADVANGGSLQQALEGVLITVKDLTVTDTSPVPGGGVTSTNDYVVTGGLRVGDFFYLTEPYPIEGDFIRSVTGVLHWANDHSKVQPRYEEDINFGPPELAALLPDTLNLEVSDDPVPALELALTRPAETDMTIALNYSDDTVISGPATVEIPAGEQRVDVELQALVASDDPVIVEASYDGITVSATIRTYDNATIRVLNDFGGDSGVYTTGSTVIFVAELDIPAGSSGETLTLEITPANDFTYDATYTFDPGQQTLEIEITLGDDIGEFTATATVGGTTVNFDFETTDMGDEFVETFDEFDASGNSYSSGSFIGVAGINWEYSGARSAEVAQTIDGKAITFGNDDPRFIRAESIPGGIRSFSVEMRKAYTGNGPRQLELLINGVSVGQSQIINVSGADSTVHVFEVDSIDVPGAFDLELRSIGPRQITIDNLSWISF